MSQVEVGKDEHDEHDEQDEQNEQDEQDHDDACKQLIIPISKNFNRFK